MNGIVEFVNVRKRILTIALALAGIAAVVFYTWCTDACGRVAGTMAGVGLHWLGLGFMAGVAVSALLRLQGLVFVLASLGVGVEAFLVGYQVSTGEYCVWCLLFAAAVLLLFAINFERRRLRLLLVAAVSGFVAVFFGFASNPIPAFAAAPVTVLPAYGSGPVKVRLYTDYYCGPCSSIEPQLEAAIAELVKRNAISVTFVDTPLHRETPLYAAHFLFALNGRNDLPQALRTRALLFDAAKMGISGREKLEGYLRGNNVALRPFEYKPVLDLFNGWLKEDRVTSTPTMVVIREGSRESYTGKDEILKGIERLKLGSARS